MLPLGLRDIWPGPKATENSVSLSKEQVQHIATLARLQLEDAEFDDMIDKLSRLILSTSCRRRRPRMSCPWRIP